MKKSKENYIIVGLSALIMIFLVHIGSTVGGRAKIDITDEGLYTLSDGSRAIVGKLNRPLRMKLYYSKTAANKGTEGIRVFNNYFGYVRSLLEEFVAHSRNNLELEVIDPRPDTKDEEDALAFGLKQFPLSETEKYFFGLVIQNSTGGEKIIEFFDPNQQEKLEYEITKLIYSINNPKKKIVGVLSSLPVVGEDMSPYMMQMMRMQGRQVQGSWTIVDLMKEFYEVKKIENNVDEISGYDIVLIIHPKAVPQQTLFAIDQYVLKGGKAMVLLDPFAVADESGGNPQMAMMGRQQPGAKRSQLPVLLTQWGLENPQDQIAGDLHLAPVGRTSQFAPPSRLLAMVQCDHRCREDYDDPVSASLNNFSFIFPGVLKVADAEGKTITPLFATTGKGNSYTAQGFEMNAPQLLLDKFKEGSSRVVLGYKVVGKFKSAFPDGIEYEVSKPAEGEGGESKKEMKKATGLKESEKDGAVIVIADVDFISNNFAFRQSLFGTAMANENATLFLNALESLSGSKELMAVRSRGRFSRDFEVVNRIEIEAEKKTQDKVDQIQSQIATFQKELNNLGRQANEGNIALIQSESVQKRKEINLKIASLKSELRDVKREGREKIESLGKTLQYLNTLFMPGVILLLGLGVYRRKRKQLYEGE